MKSSHGGIGSTSCELAADEGLIHCNRVGDFFLLHWALHFRRYDFVQVLLSRGIDANVCDELGTPFLQLIANEYFVPHVQIHIEFGANLDAVQPSTFWPQRRTYGLCKRAARLAKSSYRRVGCRRNTRAGARYGRSGRTMSC